MRDEGTVACGEFWTFLFSVFPLIVFIFRHDSDGT